jgi:Tfp pilus assembly protein PilN
MKPAVTFLLITANHIARADFTAGKFVASSAPRPGADAVRAALALGGKAAAETWLLSSEVWTQEIQLNAAQVAGLSAESLRRALAFEVEPFSGIPAVDSATGFRQSSAGIFQVAQVPRTELEAAHRTIREHGGALAGWVPAAQVPEAEDDLANWWPQASEWLAQQPVISPPAAEPSPHRFRIFGALLTLAALGSIAALWAWQAQRKTTAERGNAALAEVAQGLAAVRSRTESLRNEAAELDWATQQRQQVLARRGAVAAALEALAALRPEDVVVTELTAEGASQLVVRGLALEAGAVDEFSGLLAARLAASSWGAQTRDKAGQQALANGGPWVFAVELGHAEAKPEPAAEGATAFDP